MLIGDQLLGAGSCRGQPRSAAIIHASLEVCVCQSGKQETAPWLPPRPLLPIV